LFKYNKRAKVVNVFRKLLLVGLFNVNNECWHTSLKLGRINHLQKESHLSSRDALILKWSFTFSRHTQVIVASELKIIDDFSKFIGWVRNVVRNSKTV
jgi:hypothetical protein